MQQEKQFTDVQIAKMLGVNPVTVRQWRVKNKKLGQIKYGPPYEFHGNSVVYPVEKFRQWCSEIKVVNGVPQLNLPASADRDLLPESVSVIAELPCAQVA